MALAPPRNPADHLHAISLLAYLGADDDGQVSVEAEPDAARKAHRAALLEIHDVAERAATEGAPVEGDAASALALVSAAVDLLDAASVDAQAVGSRDVDRRFRRVRRHLLEIVAALEPAVRLDALEAEVERLQAREDVSRIQSEEDARRVGAGVFTFSPWSIAKEPPPTPPVVEADRAGLNLDELPPTPTPIADFPVGTITVSQIREVTVRLPGGWDFAVGGGGAVLGVGPSPAYEPDEGDIVIRIGDGTVPDSWLESHAEVAEIARAWLADRGHSLPAPPAPEPPPAPIDTDDDGYPF